MKAIIYCRVSTEDQEKEGTSLQTQFEACLKYCQSKGYEVLYRFSEAYSGLSLVRPKLDGLRELVRRGQVDVLIIYSLDRLTRNPTHGVIILEELEKHGVKLESVTEDIDDSELGKLIIYIKGFAAKLEAEKIKERTRRGRRAKAKLGYISGGGFARTYGYDYVKKQDNLSGKRLINESETSTVRQIYHWLVNEGISTTGIAKRLNSLGVPSKHGGYWSNQTVYSILTNKSYTGRTYAFTTSRKHVKYSKPKEEWIEIPGVTPSIISQDLFDAAQKQLQVNRHKTVNTPKHEYLLRGHIRCRQCGRAYCGGIHSRIVKGKRYAKSRYRCTGKLKANSPYRHCTNKNWMADKLEPLVWHELEAYISKPKLIVNELERQRKQSGQSNIYQSELQIIEHHLRSVDSEQHQLLQWALKDFPAEQVEVENRRLNKARQTLNARKKEIEKQLKASQDAIISLPKLEKFIELVQNKIHLLNFENKRQVFDMLDIMVWLDNENIEVTGTMDTELGVTSTIPA